MVFRSKVISFLRQKMTDMGFLEIQTPILCASSPEGARDYIVPSRKYKGKFYALPQAPQQYKQLLMVSGFDKYFQIAPCFRDEDARADRSPGEFYQLDFEMSFATQEEVFAVGEEVLTETFAKFAPEGSVVTQAPYPIISYKQAMLEFGSDKPDLRNPLRIIDLSDFFNKCTFKPFQNKTVRAINVHAKLSKGQHEKLLKFATGIGMGGLGYLEVLEDLSYKGPIDKFIPEELKGEIRELAGLQAGDTIFFIADKEDKAAFFAGQIRNELGTRLDLIEKNAYKLRRLVSHTIHSLCHRVVLKHLILWIHLIFLLISMISYVMVLNYHQVLCVTMICRLWLRHLKLPDMMKKYLRLSLEHFTTHSSSVHHHMQVWHQVLTV